MRWSPYFAIEGLPPPLDVLHQLAAADGLAGAQRPVLSSLAEHLIGDALRNGDIRRLPLADAR